MNFKSFLPACALLFIISIKVVAQKSGPAFSYNTIENMQDKLTIGLGTILDTPSQISCQFGFYTILDANPIVVQGGSQLYPVITDKRELTSYYLEGIYSANVIDLSLWHKQTLIKRIVFKPEHVEVDAPGQADVEKMLSAVASSVNGGADIQIKRVKNAAALSPDDRLVSKEGAPISNFIFTSALNYVPPVSFREDLYDIMSAGKSKVEYDELKELKGDHFKYKTFGEYFEKVHPEAASRFSTPSSMPKDPMGMAESVFLHYKVRTADNFFFNSKFIDDAAKISCRKVSFPTWKRPGTAITYFEAGRLFQQSGYGDAAIECFHSALLMAEKMNTTPIVAEYLRYRIYESLGDSYSHQGNEPFASLASQLSYLHRHLQLSSTLAARTMKYDTMSVDISRYFAQIEANARNARSEKRASFWNTISTFAMAAASAVNDGNNGLTTTSAGTQQLINEAAESASTTSDFKINSLSSSADAALAFNATYGELTKQLQIKTGDAGIHRPTMAIDFIRCLADTQLAADQTSAFEQFATKFPCISSMVVDYFKATDAAATASILQSLYTKFATAELTLIALETKGQVAGSEVFAIK